MSALTTRQLGILALWVESSCWGFSLAIFTLALRALLWGRHGMKSARDINYTMVVVCIDMLVVATGGVSLGILRQVQVAGGEGDDQEFGSASEVFRYITILVQTLIGDGVQVYRCWVVFYKSWRAPCFPFLLWIAAFGSVMAVIIYVGILAGEVTAAPPRFDAAMLVFWSISIAINILSTGLIVYRINRIDRISRQAEIHSHSTASGYRPSTLRRAIRILIESGIIYTISATLTLATFAADTNGIYITSAIEMQVVAITFNLIIIRGHNYSAGSNETTKGNTHSLRLRFRGQHSTPQRTAQDALASTSPRWPHFVIKAQQEFPIGSSPIAKGRGSIEEGQPQNYEDENL